MAERTQNGHAALRAAQSNQHNECSVQYPVPQIGMTFLILTFENVYLNWLRIAN